MSRNEKRQSMMGGEVRGEIDERAAFEKFMSKRGWAAVYAGDGQYESPSVQDQWESWQARAGIAAPQEQAVLAAVPEGWPTPEMIDAGGAAVRRGYSGMWKQDRKPDEMLCAYIFRHMLAAAPSPQEGDATAERTREQVEASQRARVAEVFGRRKPSGATADFDLIAPSDEISNPTTPTKAAAANGDWLSDVLRDMLAIQEACGLHTDEYAPGSVIEYIKELEADIAAADADGQKGGQHG